MVDTSSAMKFESIDSDEERCEVDAMHKELAGSMIVFQVEVVPAKRFQPFFPAPNKGSIRVVLAS